MTGWNFAGQNLTGANFTCATLTNADFTGATIAGATFTSYLGHTCLASSQLYSTASYQAKDLHGIGLGGNNLTGWNFAGQNLSGANLSTTTLANADFTGANLTGGELSGGTLTGANLTAADLRGALAFAAGSATVTNTILPDGLIQGLHLDSGHTTLVVHDYMPISGGPVPIHILQGMSMAPQTTLQFQLDGSAWGSTISFDAGIPVTLGGSIELGLASGVDPSGLVGDTFQLFDWTGVNPSGQFAQVVNDLPTGYRWDTSQLYTAGDVTLAPEPSTLALLAAGAIGLIGFTWQRAKERRARRSGPGF
jgi:hypothetical protein